MADLCSAPIIALHPHPDAPLPLQIRRHASIAEIAPAEWNRLAGSGRTVSHAFLLALEHSGSATPASGWRARHLSLWRDQQLAAALLLYEKDHSYGEFVFDWAWAEAYQRAGLDYYPKLVCAVPYTPVPGPRLLAADASAREALLDAALQEAEASGASSWHLLFPDDNDRALLAQRGLALREAVQFHWHNSGYRDFADFLDTLSRDKRKKIRQERRRVHDAGVSLRRVSGTQAQADDWRFVYRCYVQTYAERGRRPYLTPAFFDQLAAHSAEGVLLVIAQRDGQAIAAALNLVDDQRLYGRYWGATTFLPGLHFETCYYQGIEYCIERGLSVFEGGAQGEHKLSRGFLPVRTYSAHWLRDPRFDQAVRQFLAKETHMLGRYADELADHSPFRGGVESS